MMRAALPPAPSVNSLRRIVGSVRARLFAALLLAAAPGIVFGALEARRSYNVASRQEAAVRSDDATRAAVRLDDAVRSAAELAAVLATRREVRALAPGCAASLASAANSTDMRYAAFARTNAAGRVVCASHPLSQPMEVGAAEWFAALREGAASAVSPLQSTPLAAEPAVLIASAIGEGDAFQGAMIVVLPRRWAQQALARELRGGPAAILAYDRNGVLFAHAARGIDPDLTVRAAAALGADSGRHRAEGLMIQRVTLAEDAFSIVSATPQRVQIELGLRAALIVLAPALVAALSFAVVWLALDWWVLRWFNRLQDMAHDFGAGRYAPAAMQDAPSEISDLAGAFDAAVADARTRERDLAAALAANMSLTRELHHRVKNNLQVLSSLVSRQQRRADEPVVRNALSEARARMAPVALVYRFINPPEERTAIDLQPYLSELARQLHVALGGEARGVKLHIDVGRGHASADDATNIGLIVAETLITGYANAAGMSAATASLVWAKDETGDCYLTVGVRNGASTGRERALDRELIQEVARQLNTEAEIDPPATVRFKLTAEPAPEAR